MPTLYEMLSGGKTAEEHRKESMIMAAKRRADSKLMPKPEFDIHAGLDMLGMTPGVGVGADLLNAALYAGKGDKSSSLLSLVQAVPLLGLGTAVAKLARPSNQIRTATSYADSFQGWYKNLNELEYKNPGSVDWDDINEVVKNSSMSTQSEGFYELIKKYSKEKFGSAVTVPKPSIARKAVKKSEARIAPEKQQRIVKSPTRQKQSEELLKEKRSKKGAYFTHTKRDEL